MTHSVIYIYIIAGGNSQCVRETCDVRRAMCDVCGPVIIFRCVNNVLCGAKTPLHNAAARSGARHIYHVKMGDKQSEPPPLPSTTQHQHHPPPANRPPRDDVCAENVSVVRCVRVRVDWRKVAGKRVGGKTGGGGGWVCMIRATPFTECVWCVHHCSCAMFAHWGSRRCRRRRINEKHNRTASRFCVGVGEMMLVVLCGLFMCECVYT